MFHLGIKKKLFNQILRFHMRGNHVDIIRLKVSTFHSSKLMKKLLEDQNVIYISLL